MRALSALLAASVALVPLAGQAQSPERPASQAAAVAVSQGPDRATVVIYRDRPVDTSVLMAQAQSRDPSLRAQGLALIVETRRVSVAAGEGVIQFRGLATGIVPQSATIEGLPADIVELNADYDLISPHNLIERSVGSNVQVVRTYVSGEEEVVSGVLRAGRNGMVVEYPGGVEALDCTGMSERLVFDRVPEGLNDTPTLSVKTRAAEAGTYEVQLSYLTTELMWSADYVAKLSADGAKLDLEGWITLANFGGTAFKDAPVVVVAGDLERVPETQPVALSLRTVTSACWPMQTTDQVPEYYGPQVPPPPPPPPAPAARAVMAMAADDVVVTGNRIKARGEDLGDYKSYVLPHLTTVAPRQTKQVLFLDQAEVPTDAFWSLGLVAGEEAVAATRVVRLRNRQDQGLGVAIPAGQVVFKRPDGSGGEVLAGGERMGDVPVGLPIRWAMETSPAVEGRISQTLDETTGRGRRQRGREAYRTELTNHSDQVQKVEVELPYHLSSRSGFRIERESLPSQLDEDRGLRVWWVELAPGQTRAFDVRLSYSDPA